MTKKKANGKKKNNNLPTKKEESLPAIPGMTPGLPAGMENVDMEDILLPRLAIVQAMSRCINPDDPKSPSQGQLINTLSMETYKAPVHVVPVFYNKAAILFPEAPNDPITCQSKDSKVGYQYGECSACEFNWQNWTDGMPKCSMIHEFVCVFANQDIENALPFVISMMKTSAGIGRKWLSAAKFAGLNQPLFSRKYELWREQKENDKGKFYVWSVKPVEKVNAHDYFNLYQMLASAYAQGKVETDFSDSPDRITDDQSNQDTTPDFP